MMGGQQFSLSVLYTVQMYSELMCVGPGGLMQASLEKAVQSCTHYRFIQHVCTLTCFEYFKHSFEIFQKCRYLHVA